MTVVETRISVWEALAGRAPGQPSGPADAGVWRAVSERLNPARATPRLRKGVEEAHLVSVRGVPYVMLRSPDPGSSCYVRLTPEEVALARLMDGSRSVARLVAEFAKISGRLAPDQVTRVVADLAGNRMLDELPVDAFRRLERVHRRPWPVRLGRGLLAAARGRRMVLANVDPVIGFLYRAGGRLLFTRVVAVLCGLLALTGLAVFGRVWWRADQSVFLTNNSYAQGGLVLLGLNVFALVCHELGHALATKHAGRRVPAAGFLVYFGIPSVFVDTTDVWMAGRRARLVTTAAGPATGLVLAGVAQLVGVLFPPLAPWTFKLSFAWYLNALFNLNPFLALDGYYLLMDALEVPNLRARGLAWVIARLRRRPPRFGELDREGRLVAIYGMLAVVWLLIAGNLAYRIYTDRVTGLITGLWRDGWPARLLLVAVVGGLAAPVVYGLFGALARRWRRLVERLGESRTGRDAPRRLRSLRSSALGGLPVSGLTELAAQARWVRPRTGEQLVFAGAAQPQVYVVVDGALEARRPGDPPGTVRQRVGAGGVVGLANALTGAAAALAWHTAGTTLLAVPSTAVAAVVGPLPGPAPADRAELEHLLAFAPVFGALSEEDRLGLVANARAATVPPGAPVVVSGERDAVVVASGVVTLADGTELGAGSLIGPFGDPLPDQVGTARTSVRIWTVQAAAGLSLLPGAARSAVPGGGLGAGVAPLFGAHPRAVYPPLAAPPGPPPPKADDAKDRAFERRLWWLLILLLLLALLLTGVNLLPSPAWAEMPADRALLTVQRGQVTATIGGTPVTLRRGGRAYLSRSDAVSVPDRAGALLTFRGGSLALLCAASDLTVGELDSDRDRLVQPNGAVELAGGRILVDTHPGSAAFHPLRLRVDAGGSTVANQNAAQFAVEPGQTTVSEGTVIRDGAPVPMTPDPPTCGDGAALPVPGGSDQPTDLPSPSDPPSPSPSDSPSPSASPTPSASPSDPTATSTSGPPPVPTQPPTGGTTTTNSPSPDTTPPRISGVGATQPGIYPQGCTASTTVVYATVVDPDDPPGTLIVSFTYSGRIIGAVMMSYNPKAARYEGQLGPFKTLLDSTLSITVNARDAAGNGAPAAQGPTIATHSQCLPG